MTDRYSFSLTTFSPSGNLVQIEYALNAVSQGVTGVGIKAVNGVVIAGEKTTSVLIQNESIEKVSKMCENIGMVYSGMGPDARVLLLNARKSALRYAVKYNEDPPVSVVVKDIAEVVQEYTQSGFLLGMESYCYREEYGLWQKLLRKTVEDAIHTAIMALKEGFEGQINEYSLEVGVARSCTQPGPHGDIKHIGEFRKLTTSEIKDYLSNLV